MVDIRVNADGLKAADAVELVTKPLESIVKGINSVEHVYSQTVDDRVMVTARFKVGTNADDAILRVHDKVRANIDRIPVGIPEPLIIGRGINDVAVVVLTLSPTPQAAARYNEKDLYQIARELQYELVKTDDVGLTYISGGNAQQIRVEPDPEKLTLYGVTLQQLVAKVREANRSFQAGSVRDNDTMRTVAAGQTLAGIPDIGLLLVTTRDNRPVYVRDVAKVVIGPSPQEHRVWFEQPEKKNGPKGEKWDRVPAVSVAFAKRTGANAVVVAESLLARLHTVEGRLVPHDVSCDGHPRLWRDRQRQGQRAAVPSRARHRLHRGADRLRHRLARGGRHRRGDPDHHPAHAVCRQGDGLHHQPRQPVRVDLLHRYPGGRRHRGGGEHRPPLGDEGRPLAHAGRHRGGGRSRQSDGGRHLDRGGGAAADAVRLRPDGPLYGADPGQCLGRHAVLLLRRHGDRALADAQAAPGRFGAARERGRARRGQARQDLPPISPARSWPPASAPGFSL